MSAQVPSRGNHAWEWTPTERTIEPPHIEPCAEPNHTGVCTECGCWITIGPNRVEYGHARAANRGPIDGERRDCPHRPTDSVDPGSGGPA